MNYKLSGSLNLALLFPSSEEAPNILFIFTDDQRWDALGYAGNEIIQTPNLDALAAQGTYFDNAFVTTAICCVSRASVLTGQYARNSGVMDFFTPIELETTYARYLKEGGYYTGFIGKWGTLELDTGYFMKAADLFDNTVVVFYSDNGHFMWSMDLSLIHAIPKTKAEVKRWS